MARITFFPVILRFMLFFILTLQSYIDAAPSLQVTVHGQHLSHSKNRQNPDQKSLLSEAILTYEQRFSVNQHTTRLPERCHHTPKNKTIVICKARIQLIRPDNIIREWQHQQAVNNRVILKMEDMGLDSVEARLITVRHLSRKTLPAGMVTGTFERFSRQVHRYHFFDKTTGQTDMLLATPEHRFYSTTHKAYLPLSALNTNDRLITANGHLAKLVCPKGRHNHCGEALTGHPLRLVHNLEVAVDHVYFAGHQHLLVHNGYFYRCNQCNVNRRHYNEFNEMHRKYHTIRKYHKCESCFYSTNSLKTFKEHTNEWHMPVTCKECNVEFSSRRESLIHKNADHRKKIKVLNCEFCNRRVKRTKYQSHIDRNHTFMDFASYPDTAFLHISSTPQTSKPFVNEQTQVSNVIEPESSLIPDEIDVNLEELFGDVLIDKIKN